MTKQRATQGKRAQATRRQGITGLSVAGYKSIVEEQAIEIRPLTVLAGANSSGKSSMMQPLLLLKQTLEAPYDPGALLLNGPNVHLTSAKQLLSRRVGLEPADIFKVGVEIRRVVAVQESFQYHPKRGIEIAELIQLTEGRAFTLQSGMTHQDIMSVASAELQFLHPFLSQEEQEGMKLIVNRTRCFLGIALHLTGQYSDDVVSLPLPVQRVETQIRRMIHVPGLRGNPERGYNRAAATGPEFPGRFENYVASIISHWQLTKDQRLTELSRALETLGLGWKVNAKQVDDATVEIRIGLLPLEAHPDTGDMVSIADVGFGVSQTLPVIVALLVAEPEQLVYIEQPELHLHPRAQSAMAQLLGEAAQRGVRVVAETHSALLILGIQTLVAEGLDPELVQFHWFKRRPADGVTEVYSTNLDRAGAFDTDWPEDFADVTLRAESRYLDAAEARHLASAD